MSEPGYQAGRASMTPEALGMLNGRAAALQAATADLLQQGYLRQSAHGRLEASTSPPGHVTPLQRAVVDAVQHGASRLEIVPAVRAALDELQRDAVRRGLLNPPPRGETSTSLWLLIPACLPGLVGILILCSPHRPDTVTSLAFSVFLIAVSAVGIAGVLHSIRYPRQRPRKRRTDAGAQVLASMRAQVPHPSRVGPSAAPGSLGNAVALYGTRPLLVAFPAAAALGWGLSDHVVEEEMHRQQAMAGSTSGPNGYACSSGTSSSDWSCDASPNHSGGSGDAWCSGGNCCGSGGSCTSGSCGGSSCGGSSCGGSSCGSSCGGGGGSCSS